MENEPDPDEQEAGIDVFSKYQELNDLETLSGGDVLKWNDVKAIKYSDFLMKMMMNKDAREFNKRLQEIKRSKQK